VEGEAAVYGLRLKEEETKSRGGRRLVCICEWEWGAWFRRKKIKTGWGAAVWLG